MTPFALWSRLVAPAALATVLLAALAAAEQAVPSQDPQEEYGELLARPQELASVPSNRIARSLRLSAQAMALGRKVYDQHCGECHGADLKGLPDRHTPDLTDAEWRWSGDDLESGGLKKFPSDVEWTVRYGVRAEHPNTRGAEADMIAYDPQYRGEEDRKDFGDGWFLSLEEIDDVVDYVLALGGQQANAAKANRGGKLFRDTTKGNCYDCHGDDGTGIDTLGSTNLTKPSLYLYGSDRAAIRESIIKGRRSIMPAFEGVLKPEEIKAVSVYVFSRAKTR